MHSRLRRLLLVFGLFSALTASAVDHKPSVLFINIDDLNDWNSVLGGHPQAITPNMQRIADQGVAFSRALCSSPVCFPSRTSLFSGIHPAKSGAISNFNWRHKWRYYVKDAVTIPKHFSDNGWTTYGAAKNFHGGDKAEFDVYFGKPKEPKVIPGTGHSAGPVGWAVSADPYEEMADYKTASWAIKKIEQAEGPSFFSVGIYRPHVKWILPKSSFDKYPIESFQLPVMQKGDLDDLPERLRLLAHNEAKFGKGLHQELEDLGQVKLWARAYIASVTFADEQLGRILDAWEASAMSEDGYVILWSDHGFMLGEKEGWCKFKPWMDASRVNLIFSGPGIEKGKLCDKAVSLLDMYPTLVELLNLPKPEPQELDGDSLVPLLENPDLDWDDPVVMSHEEDGVRYDSILDNRYRMTRLITGETELYDHQNDPHEWENLADDPKYAGVIKDLEQYLTFKHPSIPHEGWLEAESLPCQTSADHGRRGNCHYQLKDERASGGSVLCAHLLTGPKSYVDFVVNVTESGDYALSTELLQAEESLRIEVSAAAVEDSAEQANGDFSLPIQVGAIYGEEGDRGLQHFQFDSVEFERTGLHIIRFMNIGGGKHELRVDRLKFEAVQ